MGVHHWYSQEAVAVTAAAAVGTGNLLMMSSTVLAMSSMVLAVVARMAEY